MTAENLANNMEADVLVLGGGPAGLCAALEARRHGADALLVDEKAEPGGQLFKQIHKFFGSEAHQAGVRGVEIGRNLLRDLDEAGVRVLLGAVAWGIFPDRWVGLARGKEGGAVHAKKIILATGASERALNFQGWTLPGVMGAGAVQTLINYYRVLPGKRAIVIGAGNVGLIVAYQMAQAGIEVLAVAEAAPRIGGYEVHAAKLRRVGIPILTGHSIARAEGDESVESATLYKLDEQWQPIAGSEETYGVDLIALAVGLSPAAELAGTAGCRVIYDNALGGHLPVHDEKMETTVPGIYVAGDLAGIEEASTAMEEGHLAGLSAAESLGLVDGDAAAQRRAEIESSLAALRLGPFGAHRATAKRKVFAKMRQETPVAARTPAGPPDSAPAGPAAAGAPVAKPYVAIECPQEIPCNPCETSCPSGAICVGSPITKLPQFDPEKCNACGRCVAACPGLAIFLIDPTFSETEGTVSLPYEFLPLPQPGQTVRVLDREGKEVGEGRIVRVRNPKSFDATPLVSVAVPKEQLSVVRHFR